uniref:Uncharacterized protein n=1 Tax=Tanacetum cinerariifolium TaxID=118510 RepID=A0A699TJS4_TANCI|nr:hypothetical protein [Tanacetum cinerariifolium]
MRRLSSQLEKILLVRLALEMALIVGIETTQRQLEADQMIASGARAGIAESIRSLTLENPKIRALLRIERACGQSSSPHVSFSGGVLIDL